MPIPDVSTIEDQSPIEFFLGDGSTKNFPVSFWVEADTDLAVYVTTLTTPLVLGSQYTVAVQVSPLVGATVSFLAAPGDGVGIAIMRARPIERLSDFPAGGVLDEGVLDLELVRDYSIMQQLKEQLDRSLHHHPTVKPEDFDTVLPLAVTGKVLGWRADGGLENVDPREGATIDTVDGGSFPTEITPIRVRRGTRAQRLAVTLEDGKPGWDGDGRFVIGDGVTAGGLYVSTISPHADFVVNPRLYGAKGDGATDDSVALQYAFDILATLKAAFGWAGKCVIPPGHYMSSKGPLIVNKADFAHIEAHGATIELMEGATRWPSDGEGQKATAVINIRDCQGVTWDGGIIDGGANNNLNGPNGFAVNHDLIFRNEVGAYDYRTLVRNVIIRNCLHDTDVDPGGLTPHAGGIGNGGGKGLTMQFGGPQCQVQNVRIHNCSIGMSYEGGSSTSELDYPDLLVSQMSVKDCFIGLLVRGVLGAAVNADDLGADYFSSIFSNCTFINCGTDFAPAGVDLDPEDFGVITSIWGVNMQMRGVRIRNPSGVVTPWRGHAKNCDIDMEVDAKRIASILDFRRDKNGADPSIGELAARHNTFDVKVKIRGNGTPGDQLVNAHIRDAGASYLTQYNDIRFSYLIGNGANGFDGNYDELTAPFYLNASSSDFDPTNTVELFDRGGGKRWSGCGIRRNVSNHHLDGMSPGLPVQADRAWGNLWPQNDQQAGILRLHAADGTTKIGLGAPGDTTSSTVCYADTDGLHVGNGAWDGRHLIIGGYHLWVDATGDLRIKAGAPANDTDGAVVGAQL